MNKRHQELPPIPPLSTVETPSRLPRIPKLLAKLAQVLAQRFVPSVDVFDVHPQLVGQPLPGLIFLVRLGPHGIPFVVEARAPQQVLFGLFLLSIIELHGLPPRSRTAPLPLLPVGGFFLFFLWRGMSSF